ncbi:PVC-type heme-binding CxxCH protein [Dyadobacter sp. CY323]|uniref:PVC-type heme-binding CxxCH protein n=1 Tax=Dyadobacter sp. CY323 TaxID=2907302 RepID=UPI001F25AEF9|nr:PVC-type heme-binding CxxCH protein [Dyadobacter sp. CY323]MCE6989767.1 dehydrogenase [Dyadobacter sp. CY323]
MKYIATATILLLIVGKSFPALSQRYPQALSPQESMRTFQLHDAFGIEPFVAEPDVLSPVDMVFDDNGNIYVVEMGDYPYDAKPGNFKGRIRLLKDSDGDSKIDKSYVYAEGLPSATSVLPWKGGIIVAAAPDILYLKDTNGDFKADSREVLFTGFFARNSEAQITSLRFGADNWIYANNNGQAGQITSPKWPDKPAIQVGGGSFRFRMDRGVFEQESGTGQFGQAIDDWGHRFYTQNTLHIQQSPTAARYVNRHAYLPSYRTDVNVSDHELEMFQKSATPHWRQQRSDRRQAKYDSLKTGNKEYARDHFTGASGATYYGGDAFPEAFYGSIFTGDVAGNLVHRDVMKSLPGQPAYTATRSAEEKDKEFLASTDNWFRPVNMALGPDGYLYLIDMYRQHIETPVSIPEDLKTDMDFANGEQHGRIWRIFPKAGEKRNVQLPDLRSKNSTELVSFLSHPNQWWRLNAQRLLLERQDKSMVPILKKAFTETKDARGRLHIMYALEGLGALDEGMVGSALADSHSGMREHGLILSEKYPRFLPEVLKLTNDPSPQVAYQASLSVGQFSGKEVLPVLANVAGKNAEQPLFRLAVLSSVPGSSAEMADLLADGGFFDNVSPGKLKFAEDFGYITGSRNGKNEIGRLLAIVEKKDTGYQAAALNGLAKGIKRSQNQSEPDKNVIKSLQKMEDKSGDEVKKAVQLVKKALNVQ